MENQTEKEANHLGLILLLIPFAVLAVVIIMQTANQIQTAPARSLGTGANTQGDPAQGVQAVEKYGCGSCHTIPGIDGADGVVGPPLASLSQRSYIAGHIDNTPDNLVAFIMHPQELAPGITMPDLGVDSQSAADIAAYLYQLK